MDTQQQDYGQLLWRRQGQRCVKNLERHGFKAFLVDDGEAARRLVLDETADLNSFGVGGSDTVRRIGLVEALVAAGKTVYDHWQPGLTAEQIHQVRLDQGRADCFMCSANGVSISGEIVNVDGMGNRTAAMSFGPRKVVIVAGMNKVAPDLTSALERVKNVAGPMRAISMNRKTPCVETGVCQDCNSPERICRITTILHRCPMGAEVTVVLVCQALGF